MLTRNAKMEGMVTSWLIGTFKLMTGEIVRPQAKINRSGDTVETSGKKMQVHQ